MFQGLVVSLNGLGAHPAVANAIVNRSDHVSLTSEHLRWRDHAATGETRYVDIVSLEADKDLEVGVLDKELRARAPQTEAETPSA